MYPEIHYKAESFGEITVFGCYGENPDIYLPVRIEGMPVTKISDYGFAKTEEEEGLSVFTPEDGKKEMIRLCGGKVEKIHLPCYVREIGKYAFYRCFCLRELSFTDSLKSIGGGAFTGCQLKKLNIICRHSRQTCLRQILEEQRFELEVHLSYEDGARRETARLIFPEHYEEAVENTPARIVETHYHGAGGDYRQCVYHKEIDYEEYDALFSIAKAREEDRTLIRIALGRLQEPYRLSEQAEEEYRAFLRKYTEQAARILLEEDDMRTLSFLLKKRIWEEECIENALNVAEEKGNAEAAAILMGSREKHAVKKKFEL